MARASNIQADLLTLRASLTPKSSEFVMQKMAIPTAGRVDRFL
jgi:hypothetical protein